MGLRRFDIVLWSAWVVAGMLGAMLTVVTALRPQGDVFGYQPGQTGYEVTLVLVEAVGLAVLQYGVLRLVVRSATLAAALWVPLTVIFSVASYLGIYAWQSSPTLRAAADINVNPMLVQAPDTLIFSSAQGVVLARIFHSRWAIGLWPVAVVIVLPAQYGILFWEPFLHLLGGLPLLAAVLIANAVVGGLYGAVTGVALVWLARRRARAVARVGAAS